MASSASVGGTGKSYPASVHNPSDSGSGTGDAILLDSGVHFNEFVEEAF